MKAADDDELGDAKGLPAHGIVDGEIADAGVNADGHVEPARLFVKGKEIRIVQRVIGFEPAHEDDAGAIAVRPTELVQSFVHSHQRKLNGPAQTVLGLGPDVGHPAIVGTAQRELDPRIIRDGPQEKCRIEDLNGGADLVHVLQPRVDVGHLARLLGSIFTYVVPAADHPPADEPKASRLARRHIHRERHRPIATILAFQVIPSLLAFNHVRVGIDG